MRRVHHDRRVRPLVATLRLDILATVQREKFCVQLPIAFPHQMKDKEGQEPNGFHIVDYAMFDVVRGLVLYVLVPVPKDRKKRP